MRITRAHSLKGLPYGLALLRRGNFKTSDITQQYVISFITASVLEKMNNFY
jgi:hypothetical protein